MHIRRLPLLVSLVLSCITAAPAVAAFTPYVRVDYGGNELRMSRMNDQIEAMEASLVSEGAPAAFDGVGSAYGPSVSAGLWLQPWFRIGAMYSYQRAVLLNGLDLPGYDFYLADEMTFRMREIGVEAAVRLDRLGGLTLGGDVAQGRGELSDAMILDNVHGAYFQHQTGRHTQMTYGLYAGFERTNPAGIAGFVRAGYRFRDMGRMPGEFSDSDGERYSTPTTSLDFSGFCLRVGVGYDFLRH